MNITIKSSYDFQTIRPYLRVIPNKELLEYLDYDLICELMGDVLYYHLENYKLDDLLKKVTGYIIQENICTDTLVGHFAFEFNQELMFSTYQPFRGSGQEIHVHNDYHFNDFVAELRKCIDSNNNVYNPEYFSCNMLVWVLEHPQEATRIDMFLDDNDIMRTVVSSCRDGLFSASIDYVNELGEVVHYEGNCRNRIVDSIFTEEVMAIKLANKPIKEFLHNGYLTNQRGVLAKVVRG